MCNSLQICRSPKELRGIKTQLFSNCGRTHRKISYLFDLKSFFLRSKYEEYTGILKKFPH